MVAWCTGVDVGKLGVEAAPGPPVGVQPAPRQKINDDDGKNLQMMMSLVGFNMLLLAEHGRPRPS